LPYTDDIRRNSRVEGYRGIKLNYYFHKKYGVTP
jgi:hypothetical protein